MFTRATVTPLVQVAVAIWPAATGSQSTANRPQCRGFSGTTPLQAGSFLKAWRFSSGWMIGSSRPNTSNRSRSAPDRLRTLMIVLLR